MTLSGSKVPPVHDSPNVLGHQAWQRASSIPTVLSDPLDPAQKTARSRRMDIDVIGAAVSQSTIQQPLDIGAVAYVAWRVEAHVVGIVGTHRDQPMTHDLWNGVRPLETLAGLGVKEYRAWCPIDAMRPSEMIGTEQHGCADCGFCEAMSAGRWVIRDLAVQRITGVITARVRERMALAVSIGMQRKPLIERPSR